MADRKTIVVMGATGAQGGGLVRAILDDPEGGFAVRAVTRDPSSAKAEELRRRGAEVVAADVDDPASLDRAFAGAYGAYCVTFYWEHMSPEKELDHARALAEAAARARLKHVVWSTLEDTRRFVSLDDSRMPTLMERYKVPHLDAKGEADRFFTELGVPTTFLLTSFYWDNLIGFGMGPKRGRDGRLVFTLPMGDAPLLGVAAEDIGRFALGIFKHPELIGKTVGVAGEALTGEQMASKLSRALGEEVRYQAITPTAYRALGFPGADDLGNMFQFFAEFADEMARVRDIGQARRLHPRLQTFDQWLEKNASRIPIEPLPGRAASDRAGADAGI